MLRVAICDDDPLALGQLCSLVEQNPDVELVGGFSGGRAFLDSVPTGRADIVLLDLEIAGLDGFETVEALADMNWTALPQPPVVVLVTSDPHFEIVAFDCGAVGILNRPVAPGQLARCLPRAQSAIRQHEARQRLFHLKSRIGELRALYDRAAACGHIAAEGARQPIEVPLASIDWVEACLGGHVLLHCGRRTYRKRASLNAMTHELIGVGFLRIDQSRLVNSKAVDHVETGFGVRAVRLRSGERLVVSRPYRTAAQALK